ncbi:hypothetical protein HDE70_002987 [Pedobacter cryoconitis]|nr:hypothetical protein [Pedobacter cryoconitis]
MNISVEYKDTPGVMHNQTHHITQVAFAKHLALSGQGYAPRIRKLIRSMSNQNSGIMQTPKRDFNQNQK